MMLLNILTVRSTPRSDALDVLDVTYRTGSAAAARHCQGESHP